MKTTAWQPPILDSFSNEEIEQITFEMVKVFARLTCGKQQVGPEEILYLIAESSWHILFSLAHNPSAPEDQMATMQKLVRKHLPDMLGKIHKARLQNFQPSQIVMVNENGVVGGQH